MAIRHYVLLATDGLINLPNAPDTCTSDRSTTLCYGFVGGLYKVTNGKKVLYENPDLDWNNQQNWSALYGKKGSATIPSPMIWADVEDKIYITLINLGMKYRPDIMDFHTVHLHGAHVPTQIDGFPESSFGVPMWMNSAEAPPNATYFFEPDHPGTYMYHCHVEASEHVQMGMYGALVIYPSKSSLAAAGITQNKRKEWTLHGVPQPQIPKTATYRNFAYNDINTYFDKEYVMLLSDIDSTWHNSILMSKDFNPVDYKPDYWLVNGRAFPDSLLPHPQTPPPGSDPNLTQINYESYVHVNIGDMFLFRMINISYQVVPWHIHGWHFMVVGKDTHPSPFLKISEELTKLKHHEHPFHMGDNNNMGMNHDMQWGGFTATIGSGETYDLLISADDKSTTYKKYITKGQDNFPSLCSQLAALDPAAIANNPTEPVSCPTPNTVNYVDICQNKQGVDQFYPQFYPMHNHDDYKVTNNGVYPGGQLTYIQTDASNKMMKKSKKKKEVQYWSDSLETI